MDDVTSPRKVGTDGDISGTCKGELKPQKYSSVWPLPRHNHKSGCVQVQLKANR